MSETIYDDILKLEMPHELYLIGNVEDLDDSSNSPRYRRNPKKTGNTR